MGLGSALMVGQPASFLVTDQKLFESVKVTSSLIHQSLSL
jgi:hypothetical protein